MLMRKNVAIVLAGGTGSRFGLDIPKQFAKLAGKTIIEHTLDTFQQHKLIDEIAIVVHKNWIWKVDEIIQNGKYGKVKKILNGGEERKDSSLSAIVAYENEGNKVNLIFHDAVRPFINNRTIELCIEALQRYNAVDVAIPATDTIIQVNDRIITNIPERKTMMQGQTPQCFKYETIKRAYDFAENDPDFKPTDDCGIVKKYLPKEEIYVVSGSISNIKVTYPQDIFLADKMIQLKKFKIDERYSDEFYRENLANRVMVIFGGSKGIGLSIADIAKNFGAKIYSFSRGETDTNVASIADVKKALEYVYQKENAIDYVVNTASILLKKPLQQTNSTEIIDIVNINYMGTVNVIKEAIPYLQKSKGGILNFTSSSYTRGRANYSLYSSTKAAIVNLTQALGEELASKDIKVNCINPERTMTPMRTENFGLEDPETLLSAEEVAYVSINTLLSDMTGQIVDVKLQKAKIDE